MTDPSTVDSTSLLSRSADLVWSEIDGEVSMLHIESGRYYGLRATGAAIWRHLTHPLRIDTLCEPLVAEYRVKRERCEADVLPFIRQLVAEGLLVVETGTGQATGTPVASSAQATGNTPLLEWELPELIVEDVAPATRGGPFGSHPAGDDAWYSS